MKNTINNKVKFTAILEGILSISVALLIMILLIKLTLNLKPIYYIDVVDLNIPKLSNMEVDEIKSNYDYVVKFIQDPLNTSFELPTLPSSTEGKLHFQEVKAIFKVLDNMAYVLSFTILILFIPVYKRKGYKFLKWSFIFLLILPLIFLIPFLINFDKSFTIFHKIFFNNDYWLLNPKTDPVIKIMPQKFFFHCVIFIIAMLSISSVLLYFLYIIKTKKLH